MPNFIDLSSKPWIDKATKVESSTQKISPRLKAVMEKYSTGTFVMTRGYWNDHFMRQDCYAIGSDGVVFPAWRGNKNDYWMI